MGEQLSRVLRRIALHRIAFWCPACNEAHVIFTGGVNGWTWNGDVEKPTFSPLIKVTGYEISADGYDMIERGVKLPEGVERYPGRDVCCHSFVTDGTIAFCGDCTHEHAGQTLPLAEWRT